MSAYSKLPPAYRSPQPGEPDLWLALTAAWDDNLLSLGEQLQVEAFRAANLDPLTCGADQLDTLSQLSLWRSLWDVSWSEFTKRQILANQAWLFGNRYDAKLVLPRLFQYFELGAIFEPTTGFKLGAAPNGNLTATTSLGVSLRDYQIKVPSYYKPGTVERGRVDFILSAFGLPWSVPIVYLP